MERRVLMSDLREPSILSRKFYRHGFLGFLFCAAGALVTPGCYVTDDLEAPEVPPEAPHVQASIDEDGAITSPEDELDFGGHWYAYGDGPGGVSAGGAGGAGNSDSDKWPSCTGVGMHVADDCSKVDLPLVKVPELGFKNFSGRMCASGTVAQVLTCCRGKTDGDGGQSGKCSGENTLNCFDKEALDYTNIWGAGIGFDFKLEPTNEGRDYEAIAKRGTWSAADHGVIGISFQLEWGGPERGDETSKEIPLRVEFPVEITQSVTLPLGKGTIALDDDGNLQEIPGGEELPAGSSSESHSFGSPYWYEGEAWVPSPVVRGFNKILWTEIQEPPQITIYESYLPDEEFTGDNLLGIQFHVIPDDQGNTTTPFSFCISDLRFLLKEEEPAE
jgi:hypothetical protein